MSFRRVINPPPETSVGSGPDGGLPSTRFWANFFWERTGREVVNPRLDLLRRFRDLKRKQQRLQEEEVA